MASQSERIKVSLVGNAHCGKTSFLRALTGVGFQGAYEETLSLRVETIMLGEGEEGDPRIALELWDMGGNFVSQDPRTFYGNTDIIILCYDVSNRASFNAISSFWFGESKVHCGRAVKMCVGMKNDLATQRGVSIKEAENLATSLGVFFMEVSAMDGTNIDLIKKILRIRAQHVLRRRHLIRAVRAEAEEHSSPKTQAPSSHSSPKLQSMSLSSPSMSSTTASPSFASRRTSTPYSGGYDSLGYGSLPPETSPSPRSIRPRDTHPTSILTPVAWKEDILTSTEESPRIRSKPRTNLSTLELEHIEHIHIDSDRGEYDGHSEHSEHGGSSSAMERTESEETLEEGAQVVKISLQSPRPQALASSKRVDLSRRYQQLRDELAREHDSKDKDKVNVRVKSKENGVSTLKHRDVKRPSSASSSPKLTSVSSKGRPSSSEEPKGTKRIRRVKRGVVPTHEDGGDHHRHDTSAWTPPKLKSYENVHGKKVAVLETNLVKARTVGSPTQILTEIPGKPRESSPSSHPSKRRLRKEADKSPIAEKPSLYINISIGDGRTGQIGVRDGDNAYQLAEAFVRAFHLDRSNVGKIATLIQLKVAEYGSQVLKKSPAKQRGKKEGKTNVKPFSFHGRDSTKRAAILLKLHVDVGKGKFGTIAVRKGDDPSTLARNFAQTFSLKPDQIPTIESRIKEEIVSYYLQKSESLRRKTSHKHSGEVEVEKPPRTLFYMDVEIGDGRHGRLRVIERKSAGELARNFANRYKLTQSTQEKLEGLISRNLEIYHGENESAEEEDGEEYYDDDGYEDGRFDVHDDMGYDDDGDDGEYEDEDEEDEDDGDDAYERDMYE
eukprot:TRINITY_DN383_c0_g3_i1.p1 TRINITY_DN383_c0_g3~~TRINITY_DN383_c0_g3_i1.p1  ORF type:complete len:836 (+),score=234.99 TRINITY_DN383_c0_g3_i1:370-2877(+)